MTESDKKLIADLTFNEDGVSLINEVMYKSIRIRGTTTIYNDNGSMAITKERFISWANKYLGDYDIIVYDYPLIEYMSEMIFSIDKWMYIDDFKIYTDYMKL